MQWGCGAWRGIQMMLESNCMLIAGRSRGPESLFTCAVITSGLRRRWPNIQVSYIVLHCSEKWTGGSMVSQVANNWVWVWARAYETDFNWCLEHTGRSLRVYYPPSEQTGCKLGSNWTKEKRHIPNHPMSESHQTAPPLRRLIIHCLSAGRQFELRKSGPRIFRKETCCQKKNSPLKRWF